MMNKPTIVAMQSENRKFIEPMGIVFWGILCLSLASGCGKATFFTEYARIEDKISDAEMDSFLSIIDSLPDKKLPLLPATLLPKPHWTQERTLPIQDLVRQETDAIKERWSVEWMTRLLPKSKALSRALRREEMTPKQFIGFALAIGAALTADAVDKSINLEQLVEEATKNVDKLATNETAFHSLDDEATYEILEQASWITVKKRVDTILKVPPENLSLVRKHRERLDEIFPEDLKRDPLSELASVWQKQGIPFNEMPESGSDKHLEWDRSKAIIGSLP